ncbi:MAG: DUF4253 domain-containing protein [Planctomycetota bacterium]
MGLGDVGVLRAALGGEGVPAASVSPLFTAELGPVMGMRMPGGGKALAAWRKASAVLGGKGWTPVLLGATPSVAESVKRWSSAPPLASLALDRADRLDVLSWLASVRDPAACEPPARGDWPSESEIAHPVVLSVSDPVTHQALSDLVMAFLPIAEASCAFAWLGFGGWRPCPDPSMHVAVARYWQRVWGAVPISITADVVEYVVPNPPATREQAVALALEQYRYCPDIVEHGVGTIESLAATLMRAQTWYFWWDRVGDDDETETDVALSP